MRGFGTSRLFMQTIDYHITSCLLSSYGAALFPFTHTWEIQYFIDCCLLLNIREIYNNDPIALFSPPRVDSRIGAIRNGSGYDWIEDIHTNCIGQSFIFARERVNISRVNRVKVEEELHNNRCSSIFSLHFPNDQAHSICIIKDPEHGYVARDSSQLVGIPKPGIDAVGLTIEKLIENLYNMKRIKIGESILISEKSLY